MKSQHPIWRGALILTAAGFASRFIPRVVDVLPEDLDDWKGLRWSRRSRRDKDSGRKPE